MIDNCDNLTNWDKRFYNLALHIAKWSKDPITKVGCVIVNDKNSVVSLGFNGIPRGVVDLPVRLEKPTKYNFVVHAENNSILNAALNGGKVENCILYVTMFPCNNCSLSIIQSGIKKIVCPRPDFTKDKWKESFGVSLEMLQEAGILITYFEYKNNLKIGEEIHAEICGKITDINYTTKRITLVIEDQNPIDYPNLQISFIDETL